MILETDPGRAIVSAQTPRASGVPHRLHPSKLGRHVSGPFSGRRRPAFGWLLAKYPLQGSGVDVASDYTASSPCASPHSVSRLDHSDDAFPRHENVHPGFLEQVCCVETNAISWTMLGCRLSPSSVTTPADPVRPAKLRERISTGSSLAQRSLYPPTCPRPQQ
ncbi:hypothetical protein BDY17DRAFT_98919 [Neohortaea acidophila]|uniref:Uncharacterized protein n=1 Tax=Neohortaea acidophila TaxID=245834 RepID=A0A6A6Q0K2_9PEZI|nr:uncharacterized protein BDY17DRAFT_98919 [Neohortaea acidophila]KAF2485213.1 hypothetical protein BDY17DRAFT_98919 [Neohortaea acidophila]